ncbi:MAG: phenylacetate--CoA ligase, partial [Synergistota bacterium]|nr:phenylacetate--CoA ligase [Synergistota bacterium]
MENRAARSKALQGTVRAMWDNVPFYRARMEDWGVDPAKISDVDDLRRLPFMTKNDLRDNYPLGLLACGQEEVVRVHASSGTTGKPTVVAYVAEDIAAW